MEWIGIILSIGFGLYMIVGGAGMYLFASGVGSVHKFDYIYPIIILILGLAIEYYVFFHAINISINVTKWGGKKWVN